MAYINTLQLDQHLDKAVVTKVERFFKKVNERLLFKMGVLPSYDDEGDPALGLNVEYFHFSICGDDRMRYLGKNVVLEPNLSARNRWCNAVITHLYGGRCIHSLFTGVTDPKKSHIDFERVNTDPAYVQSLYESAAYAKLHGYKFYGTTELHTSLQTAARNFCRKKYSDPTRAASNTDIVEWVASFIPEGLVDDLLFNTKTLEEAYTKINHLQGVGAYYGYHLATDSSLLPETPYHHDEQFCVPGPGACATMDLMFPTLNRKGGPKNLKVPHGELICWIEQNQKRIYPNLTFDKALWNIEHPETGTKLFKFEQDKLMVYGLEVGHCQYGIYERLTNFPHLVAKRQCGADPDLTPLKAREAGNPLPVPGKVKKAEVVNNSCLLEF